MHYMVGIKIVDPLEEPQELIEAAKKDLDDYLSQFPPEQQEAALDMFLADSENKRLANTRSNKAA